MIFSDIEKCVRINISEDFSDIIGGEYIKNGRYSGELFRKILLEPYLSLGYRVYIKIGDVYEVPFSFIRGAFENISTSIHKSINGNAIVIIINNAKDEKTAMDISEYIEITTIMENNKE